MSAFRYIVDLKDMRVNKVDPEAEPVEYETVLRGWHTLHYYYNSLTLIDCLLLLRMELEGNDREMLVTRLMSRIRKLCGQDITEVLNDFANKTRKSKENKRKRSRTVPVQKDQGDGRDSVQVHSPGKEERT